MGRRALRTLSAPSRLSLPPFHARIQGNAIMAHPKSAALPASQDLRSRKRDLRGRALAQRAAIAEDPPANAPARAGQLITRDILPAGDLVVAGFWSMGSEPECRPILEALWASGYRGCLPVVTERRAPLVFRRWEPGVELVSGLYGEAIPPLDAETMSPDLLIVPGLAFDREGFRLGYGAGYYDRTLASLRAQKAVIAVGLAYSGQLVSEVPREGTDEPLDWIVTEDEAIPCAEQLAPMRLS